MATVNIDGAEYETEDLSEGALAQLESLQTTDLKIAQMQTDLAIFQTARNAYASALRDALEQEVDG